MQIGGGACCNCFHSTSVAGSSLVFPSLLFFVSSDQSYSISLPWLPSLHPWSANTDSIYFGAQAQTERFHCSPRTRPLDLSIINDLALLDIQINSITRPLKQQTIVSLATHNHPIKRYPTTCCGKAFGFASGHSLGVVFSSTSAAGTKDAILNTNIKPRNVSWLG